MRRMRVLLLAFGLVVGAAGVAGSAAGSQASSPRLVLTATAPMTLRGFGFKPAEHIRVTVTVGSALVRRTTTSSAIGRFRMTFPSLAASDCTGVSAIATGLRGDRASFFLKRPPGVCALS